MIKNYIKIAYRNLIKNKAYAFINILGLAIGISVCLVIFLLTNFELSFDNFHADRERIYRVTSTFQGEESREYYNSGISAPMPAVINREVSGIKKLSAVMVMYPTISVPQTAGNISVKPKKWTKDDAEVVACYPEYFEIFSYEWLQGNSKAALSAANTVVLTDKSAERYFGKIAYEDMMGQQVVYNDSIFATVTGVVKTLPQNTDLKFEDFLSFKTIEIAGWREEFGLDEWTNTNGDSQLFVKLEKGTLPEKVNAQFKGFLLKNLDQTDRWNVGRSISLQPFTEMHFDERFGDSYSRHAHLPTLYAMMGVAVFLLLIAAINFINLSTARSINRIKEIGVRKALGGNRKNLIFQFLSETFLLTFVSVLLSVVLVNPILWAYKSLIPSELTFDLSNPLVGLFLVGITLVTSLLSGLYPAWVISSHSPVDSLKNKITGGKSRTAFLRKCLIIFQFTTSQVFILGTILVASQSHFMLNKDMGFKQDAIVSISTDWRESESAKKFVFIEKLSQFPEIEATSLGRIPAMNGYSTNTVKYFDGEKEIETSVHRRTVDANYIPMFGLEILAGRNVVTSDTAKEFVINETYAKQLGFEKPADAIGKFLIYQGGKQDFKLPIVGVIADFHLQSLHEPINPLYIMSETKHEGNVNVKIRSDGKSAGEVKSAMAKIQKAYKEVYAGNNWEFTPNFVDETVAKFYEKEQKFTLLMNTVTFIAILISCMGLYGLAMFTTEQRTKEIGIRKVLGASVGRIITLLSKDFLMLVALSIIAACPIAYYFMREWLQDFAFRVPISGWIFALAAALAIATAFLTVSYQSIKAALMNPVKSLKVE
jgi:predicted permease